MIKIHYTKMVLIALSALSFTSCKKDENTIVSTENFKGYFIVNEGGFNKSNGSLGLYKPGTKTYIDAFKLANNRPLGDIVQSMTLIDAKYYIAVNNSNKIEVVNQGDFKSVATINVNSPRYILRVSNNKAYVSNLYNNAVQILDLNGKLVSGSVNINHWSESMALMNGKAYINANNDKVMIVDVASDALVDSIALSAGLTKVVNAGADKLGVLCAGALDWTNGSVITDAKFYILSKDSNKVSLTVPLTGAGYGGSLIYANSAFYIALGNNIVKKITLDGVVSDFITLPTTVAVYGLSVGANGDVFVTDAGDFNSAGKVYVYNSSGVKQSEFDAGIAPNAVIVNE